MQPAPRMLPSQQRLDAAHLARRRGPRPAGRRARTRRARGPAAGPSRSCSRRWPRRGRSARTPSSRSLPCALAEYMAMSALRSSSSAVCSGVAYIAMPTLARTSNVAAVQAERAPQRLEDALGDCTRGLDRPGRPRAGRRTRRRPSAPRVSAVAHACRMRAGHRDQQLVAARRGPRLSLTALKSSRSRKSTASGGCAAARPGRGHARAGRGTAPGWAGPVSESWNAWWRSCSSSERRSVTSR